LSTDLLGVSETSEKKDGSSDIPEKGDIAIEEKQECIH
jgi:hypothetical protein